MCINFYQICINIALFCFPLVAKVMLSPTSSRVQHCSIDRVIGSAFYLVTDSALTMVTFKYHKLIPLIKLIFSDHI